MERMFLAKRRGVGFFIKPFVRDKLMNKHIDICKRMFRGSIEYAAELGLDSKVIVEELLKKE